jgi:acyl-CoA hydrolase
VSVRIFIEEMYSDIREMAIEGEFVFVALDDEKKPTLVL